MNSNVSNPSREHSAIAAAAAAATATATATATNKDLTEKSESTRTWYSLLSFISKRVHKIEENIATHFTDSDSDIDPNISKLGKGFAKNKKEETIDIEKFLTRLRLNQKFSDDVHYRIESSVKLENNDLVALPNYLTVNGKFTLDQCPNLESMPKHLFVHRNCVVKQCPKLEAISELLIVMGGLVVRDCPIKNLGKNCAIGLFLTITGCPHLEELADNDLALLSYAEFEDCPKLKNLGKKISTGSSFIIRNCDSIETLPKLDISMGEEGEKRDVGSVILRGCNNLKSFPHMLSDVGYMSIDNCPQLQHLDYGITVRGSVDISHCDDLKNLCGTLTLGEDLIIRKCPKLNKNKLIPKLSSSQQLSKKLTISKSLFIKECPNLEKLCNKLDMMTMNSSSISFQ